MDYFNIEKDIKEYESLYGLNGVIEAIDYNELDSQIVVKFNKLEDEYESVEERFKGLEVVEQRIDLLIFWDSYLAENLL